MKYGISLPQGWTMDLGGIGDTDEQAQALVRAMFPEGMRAQYESAINYSLIGTIDTIRKRLAVYEAVGVQELILAFPDATRLDSIRRFAQEFIA